MKEGSGQEMSAKWGQEDLDLLRPSSNTHLPFKMNSNQMQ